MFRAVLRWLARVAVFFVAQELLGNGDGLLVAAVVYAVAEAYRRCHAFQVSAPGARLPNRERLSVRAMRAKG